MDGTQTPSSGNGANNELGTPLKIVSFCFPIVGAILYFVKKDNEPAAAKSACTMALIGMGVGIVFYILAMVLGIMGGMAGS